MMDCCLHLQNHPSQAKCRIRVHRSHDCAAAGGVAIAASASASDVRLIEGNSCTATTATVMMMSGDFGCFHASS